MNWQLCAIAAHKLVILNSKFCDFYFAFKALLTAKQSTRLTDLRDEVIDD